MNIHQLYRDTRPVPDDAARLAATLRSLAREIERGEVSRIIITVVRPNGDMERIGGMWGVTKSS